jgi:hypothetical protein
MEDLIACGRYKKNLFGDFRACMRAVYTIRSVLIASTARQLALRTNEPRCVARRRAAQVVEGEPWPPGLAVVRSPGSVVARVVIVWSHSAGFVEAHGPHGGPLVGPPRGLPPPGHPPPAGAVREWLGSREFTRPMRHRARSGSVAGARARGSSAPCARARGSSAICSEPRSKSRLQSPGRRITAARWSIGSESEPVRARF